MIIDSALIGLLSTIIGAWLTGVEVRMKNLGKKIENHPSRTEVNKTIDLKQEAIKVLLQEAKEDIKKIDEKLDKILYRDS